MISLRDKKGFTLLELILVVIVLGILATLAVPRFQSMAEKARAAEAINTIGAIKTAEDLYKVETGSYVNDAVGDGTVLAITFPVSGSTTYWTYAVSGGSATAYTVTATRTSKAGGAPVGKDKIILKWDDAGTPFHEDWSTSTHIGAPRNPTQ